MSIFISSSIKFNLTAFIYYSLYILKILLDYTLKFFIDKQLMLKNLTS